MGNTGEASTVGEAYGKIADQKEKDRAAHEEIDTVWKAAAYGDTDKLKEYLEADSKAANQPDSSGYYPLHWASLNNRVAAITLLFQYGANIENTEPGGQTALHWAATRGALPSVELLLRSGAKVGAVDSRGYTVCHVAAQYGQTALLHHLALKWETDVDVGDGDGRSPLHWAAYKGYGDPIRLLLCLGCRALLTDKEGCTPLHWAAIKGHSEACTLLVQGGGGEALSVADTTGSTPSQLAMQKGHMMCADWLSHERGRYEREVRNKGGIVIPRGMKHLAPVLWSLILGLLALFLNFVCMSSTFTVMTALEGFWGVVVVACAGGGLIFLARAGTKDPGFICCGDAESNKSKADREPGSEDDGKAVGGVLDDPLLWDGNWHMLCLQCRKVRPARSKYCRVAKRCVARFDHYCPWIGNTVGEKNHRDFVLFLILETAAMVVALLVAIYRLYGQDAPVKELFATHTGAVMFVMFDGLMLFSVSMLTCSQVAQVFQNITTNEVINQHRYKYLHSTDGAFNNPFDKGCWPNTVEFFGAADCLPLLGTSTDAPLHQSFEERGSLLGGHTAGHALGHARHSAPAACGRVLGACAGLCGSHGHGHGHGHHGHSHGGHGCCKEEHAKVKDIEDGL